MFLWLKTIKTTMRIFFSHLTPPPCCVKYTVPGPSKLYFWWWIFNLFITSIHALSRSVYLSLSYCFSSSLSRSVQNGCCWALCNAGSKNIMEERRTEKKTLSFIIYHTLLSVLRIIILKLDQTHIHTKCHLREATLVSNSLRLSMKIWGRKRKGIFEAARMYGHVFSTST